MSPVFILLSLTTIGGAVAAMCLRNLVHCVLALTMAFAGLAALYLQLGAQFAGFAQLLIYVGAVAILIVFAILLTRGSEASAQRVFSSSGWLGAAVAAGAFAVLTATFLSSKSLPPVAPANPNTTVGQIGDQLMTHYVLPLEVLGLLLTVALIGAVIIAMRERPSAGPAANPSPDSLDHPPAHLLPH